MTLLFAAIRTEYIIYLMVGPEVVNLPPEHFCPEVFTNELHYIQFIFKAGRVPCQSTHERKIFSYLRKHFREHVLVQF